MEKECPKEIYQLDVMNDRYHTTRTMIACSIIYSIKNGRVFCTTMVIHNNNNNCCEGWDRRKLFTRDEGALEGG